MGWDGGASAAANAGAGMKFLPLEIGGAFTIEPEHQRDERGSFARTWDREEFERQGLDAGIAQCSVSFNAQRGTLRGMHVQRAPHEETKLVRCTRGAMFDVLLDLRRGSRTFLRWAGVELNAEEHRAVYVPT